MLDEETVKWHTKVALGTYIHNMMVVTSSEESFLLEHLRLLKDLYCLMLLNYRNSVELKD